METRSEIGTCLRSSTYQATPKLFTLLLPELREIAQRSMRRERENHTLQPTAVVNEAFLRLVDSDTVDWQGRTHFCAVASLCMRQILQEHARNRNRQKRGGGWKRVTLSGEGFAAASADFDVHAVHEALEELEQVDDVKARIVELKFFSEMTNEDVSTYLEYAVAIRRAALALRARLVDAAIAMTSCETEVGFPWTVRGSTRPRGSSARLSSWETRQREEHS